MKSMHLLLNEAEHTWREDVRRDFPLRSDTPVIRKTSPNGRDWTFSTDLRKIFAEISGDDHTNALPKEIWRNQEGSRIELGHKNMSSQMRNTMKSELKPIQQEFCGKRSVVTVE